MLFNVYFNAFMIYFEAKTDPTAPYNAISLQLLLECTGCINENKKVVQQEVNPTTLETII